MSVGSHRPHPATLEGTLHNPTRLAVAAFLSACAEAEFGVVRDHCQVSDSVMSKAASALDTAGYLGIRKGYVGKRPRTWLSLTPAGHEALAQHVAALQDIVAAAQHAATSADARPTTPPGPSPQS
ncbi:winged helix-turn-helix domain-containing protein [Streptomyces iconiensis]|uniref:Transcriptional regulator n=1 Tax=Streptomyces iconiensis TaxID=1384038 RepID=A0ABT6ZYY5_9ACTN|nr:transcriptional regulator [Streptomyces iconiensis]MDJ1134272.1 transcriptional regulator [Streptomyces iconiensis]